MLLCFKLEDSRHRVFWVFVLFVVCFDFFRMAAVSIDLFPLSKLLLRMSSVGNQGLRAPDPSAFTLG